MPDDSWIAGYFTDFKEAIQSVIDNVADVFEHCYNYAVIMKYPQVTKTMTRGYFICSVSAVPLGVQFVSL